MDNYDGLKTTTTKMTSWLLLLDDYNISIRHNASNNIKMALPSTCNTHTNCCQGSVVHSGIFLNIPYTPHLPHVTNFTIIPRQNLWCKLDCLKTTNLICAQKLPNWNCTQNKSGFLIYCRLTLLDREPTRFYLCFVCQMVWELILEWTFCGIWIC